MSESPRILSVARMREIWGAKAAAMTDADLEAIARRAYAYVRVVRETLQAQRRTAAK